MRSGDFFVLAWRNLQRRKSRTILTVLSFVIGIVAIVLMMSLGYGIEDSQKQWMSDIGNARLIRVLPRTDGIRAKQSQLDRGLLRQIEGVKGVQAAYGAYRLSATLTSNQPGIGFPDPILAVDGKLIENEEKLQEGSGLAEGTLSFVAGRQARPVDKRGGEQGEAIADYDFASTNYYVNTTASAAGSQEGPFRQSDREKMAIQYGGRLSSNNFLAGNSYYVSLNAAQKIKKAQEDREQGSTASNKAFPFRKESFRKSSTGEYLYDMAYVVANSLDDVEEVENELKNRFNLDVMSNKQILQSQQQAMMILQMVFFGIGSISLLVAAIGIANTMLMSIQERVKEIGVMKVIGARVRDIRRMFLMESMLMGLLGGLVGILITYLISWAINSFAYRKLVETVGADLLQDFAGVSIIPLWLPPLAFLFSAMIGLLAGYFPARRATKLSAIDAIHAD